MQQYISFFEELGAPVDLGLRRAGLQTQFDGLDEVLPVRNVWSFVEDMARREGVEGFGWRVGRRAGTHILDDSLVAHVSSEPTLYQGLRRLITLVGIENSHVEIGLAEHRDHVVFWQRGGLSQETSGYHQTQPYSLTLLIELIRLFAGPNWYPPQLAIEAEVIPQRARELFPRTRFYSGQGAAAMKLERSLLPLRPLGTDSDHRSWSDTSVGAAPTDSTETDFLISLRQFLATNLDLGCLSIALAAEISGTSVRTLQRRLSRRHLTYSSLIAQIRFEKARQLLEDPVVRVIDVACAIGYRDASHFARAFRHIAGVSPTQYRASQG